LWSIWLISPAPGALSELARTQQKLAEIQSRIETTSATLEDKKRRERTLLDDLQSVEKTRKRLGRRIAELDSELARLKDRIGREKKHAETLRDTLAGLSEQVRRRLVAIYKTGDGSFLRLLFGAESPEQMAEDYDFLGRIVGRDRDLIDRYRARLEERQAALERLARLEKQQQAALADSKEQQATLKKAEKVKHRLVAALRKDQSSLARQLEDLQEGARRLAALIKSLESENTAEYTEKTGLFPEQKGRLEWPLPGRVTVHFGTSRHPDLGTLHDSQGIEIACQPTCPVRAVWGGRVVFANEFKGYGNLMIVDHGDSFYSLYAQVARLEKKVGDRVSRGETIALSAPGEKSRVYFEIRQSGTPLDPEDWLAPR
jgi:septal ring factor EnvC (AmiA/AmiB activator)